MRGLSEIMTNCNVFFSQPFLSEQKGQSILWFGGAIVGFRSVSTSQDLTNLNCALGDNVLAEQIRVPHQITERPCSVAFGFILFRSKKQNRELRYGTSEFFIQSTIMICSIADLKQQESISNSDLCEQHIKDCVFLKHKRYKFKHFRI